MHPCLISVYLSKHLGLENCKMYLRFHGGALMSIICKGKGKCKGASKVKSKECPFQTLKLMPECQIIIPVHGSKKGDKKHNGALWTEVYRNCRNSNIKQDKKS